MPLDKDKLDIYDYVPDEDTAPQAVAKNRFGGLFGGKKKQGTVESQAGGR